MQATSSAVLFSILASVSLLACGADTPETPDARIVTPRPDARTLPDARFEPFIDAMNMPDAAPLCDDPSEPNDTENTSTVLGAITDCDNTGGAVSGAVDSADEDWFSYAATDVGGCLVDPTVSIATGSVEVCLFLVCMAGATEIVCPEGTTATTVGTLEGCCGTGVEIEMDLDCDGFSDDSTNFIRVKSMSAASCEPYTVGYNY